MGYGDTFKFYDYASDRGDTFVVKLSSAIASEGGFTENTDPQSGIAWPYNSKNMRHVWGKASSGKRARVPIAAADDDKFTSGGTFTLHTVSYTIQGAIGEQRKLSALGG